MPTPTSFYRDTFMFNCIVSIEKLNEVKAKRDAAFALMYHREDCADNNICPDCGVEGQLKETGYHDLSGTCFYKCKCCGSKMNGSMFL